MMPRGRGRVWLSWTRVGPRVRVPCSSGSGGEDAHVVSDDWPAVGRTLSDVAGGRTEGRGDASRWVHGDRCGYRSRGPSPSAKPDTHTRRRSRYRPRHLHGRRGHRTYTWGAFTPNEEPYELRLSVVVRCRQPD